MTYDKNTPEARAALTQSLIRFIHGDRAYGRWSDNDDNEFEGEWVDEHRRSLSAALRRLLALGPPDVIAEFVEAWYVYHGRHTPERRVRWNRAGDAMWAALRAERGCE